MTILKKILIRVDAAKNIGIGHVMRCLTLAHSFKSKGHQISFICRKHDGHMAKYIHEQGFKVFLLPSLVQVNRNDYSTWVGTQIEHDAQDCIKIIQNLDYKVDWMIIDHYGIDETWENLIKEHVDNIFVIDDLANRIHQCDILLDQNFTHGYETRYDKLVSNKTIKLLGPKYTLLRDEFLQARKSLPNKNGDIKRLFVFFGGSDDTGETLKVLQALEKLNLSHIEIDIVVGINNSNKEKIKFICNKHNNIHYHFNIDYMACIMTEADLAICASGSTTWERYCLGLPGIVIAIAENQVPIAEALVTLKIDNYLGFHSNVTVEEIIQELKISLQNNHQNLLKMKQQKCLEIVDGRGVEYITNLLN